MSIPEPISAPSAYLGFPFRITTNGARQSGRQLHIKELVIQTLLTAENERVFLPEFGIGLQRLLFAPMTDTLWDRVETRLVADLSEVLRGDADTSSIVVSVRPDIGNAEILRIKVKYRLAAIDRNDSVELALSGDQPLNANTQQRELL